MATTPNDSQVHAPSGYGMPIAPWYTDDAPWNPIAKFAVEPAYDRSLSKPTDHRNPISLYSDQSLPETGQFHPRAPQSDSDYGTYRSYESSSTFGANVGERNPHNHCMAGKASQHDSSTVDSGTPGSLPCQDPIEPNLELKDKNQKHSDRLYCQHGSCGRSFTRSSNLKRHEKTAHSETISENDSVTKYRCPVPNCASRGQDWKRRGSLERHLNTIHSEQVSTYKDLDAMIECGAQDLVARKNPIPGEKSLEADQGPAIVQPSEIFLGPAQIPMASIILDGYTPSLQTQTPVTDEILIDVIRKASAAANLFNFSTGHQDYAGTSSSNNTDDSIESKDQEADKKVSKFLELIREEGYTISKNSVKARELNRGTAAARKSNQLVLCPICKGFQGRPGELKKHMLRHTRPYGCTFRCNKTFGSRTDWTRHENSQHLKCESWQCDLLRTDKTGACAKKFFRSESFRNHLGNEHTLDSEILKEKLETCHIERNGQKRFWCGFCVRTIQLKNTGIEAWEERFDHIEEHFRGKNDMPQVSMQNWISVEGEDERKVFNFVTP